MKQQINCGAVVLDISAIYEPDSPRRSWRDRYPVHPCAAVVPMMPDAELEALAQDIKTNGQRQAVVLCRVAGTLYVLDGRNRLEAMARVGLDRQVRTTTLDLTDPAAFVIGANIRRRHLTKEQQAELIVKTIEAGQIDSANVARSFNTTAGKKGGSTKDPVLTAAVEEGKKHGISKRTVQNARAKSRGKTPAPRPAPRPAKQPLWERQIRQVITKARRSASADAIRQVVLALLKTAR